jgi:guanylate kinase
VVISGPSGVGKDSLLTRLRELQLPAHFTVTATTRPQHEVDPADHEFLSFLTEEEFERLLANDGLLEHANVYGYRYGVPKSQVRDALARGKDVVMRVDVQGAATIKRLVPGALLIFLAPPSVSELEGRLRERRRGDSEDAIQRRLDAARREMDQSARFDYVVVNEEGRLDDAVQRVVEIIKAERTRAGRPAVTVA